MPPRALEPFAGFCWQPRGSGVKWQSENPGKVLKSHPVPALPALRNTHANEEKTMQIPLVSAAFPRRLLRPAGWHRIRSYGGRVDRLRLGRVRRPSGPGVLQQRPESHEPASTPSGSVHQWASKLYSRSGGRPHQGQSHRMQEVPEVLPEDPGYHNCQVSLWNQP